MNKIIDFKKKGEKLESADKGMEFVMRLTKLEPMEVYGVATLLKVKVSIAPEGEKPTIQNTTLRTAEELFSDMIDAFVLLNREDKRHLLKLMKDADGKKKGLMREVEKLWNRK